jgi:hypothetical protein
MVGDRALTQGAQCIAVGPRRGGGLCRRRHQRNLVADLEAGRRCDRDGRLLLGGTDDEAPLAVGQLAQAGDVELLVPDLEQIARARHDIAALAQKPHVDVDLAIAREIVGLELGAIGLDLVENCSSRCHHRASNSAPARRTWSRGARNTPR